MVSVRLANPDSQFLDSARIRIWFDPTVLEVVDWDKGNWIKRGVNVQDAFAREQYPFAFHRANEADNLWGVIDYEMGMADRFVPPDGDLFKIKFRALEPSGANAIWFVPTETAEGPATALFSEGRNVLDYAALIERPDMFLAFPVLPTSGTQSVVVEADGASLAEGDGPLAGVNPEEAP